jgi:hypothetical protein
MDRRSFLAVRPTGENTFHISAVLLEDWFVIPKANTVRFDDLRPTVFATSQSRRIRR